jgi:DHA1 family multidrug resistance protein-like MFS transporter
VRFVAGSLRRSRAGPKCRRNVVCVVLRWKSTLVASWVAQICSTIGFAMCIPFLPPFVRELGIHDERAVLIWSGWLSTAAGVIMALVAPIWGTIADRHGRKLMVMRSMFGGMIVLGGMAYVHSVHELLALRMLQGVLTGTVAASVALVGSVVPPRRAGFALGLMHTATYIGNSLGPGVGGRLAYAYGLRIPFLCAAGFLLLGGLLTMLGVHEDFDPDEASERGGEVNTIRQVFALTGFTTLAGLLFLVMFAGSFVGPILPLYVERLAGGGAAGSTKITGDILALGGIAAAVSATILGRMGDRLGYSKVLTLCTLLTGLTLIPHALVHSPNELLFWRLLTSFTGAGTIPAVNALIRHMIPRHACGKAYGLMQTLSCLGWGFGPLVGSSLAAQFGMRLPFIIVGLVFVVISGLVYRSMPRIMRQIALRPVEEPAPVLAACGAEVEAVVEEALEAKAGSS